MVNELKAQMVQIIKQYQPDALALPPELWKNLFNAPMEPVLDETWGAPPGPSATPTPPPAQPHKKDKGKRLNSHQSSPPQDLKKKR